MDATMGQLVYLPAGVAGPDPDAFLSDVLTGWRRAQLAQNFSPDTACAGGVGVADGRFRWVLIRGSGLRPMPMIFGHLRGVRNLAHTTVRAYQTDVKLFLDYATDPAYDWNGTAGTSADGVFSGHHRVQ